LKMVFQARMQRDEPQRTLFLSLGSGYHGDTVGAMSAGHSARFHQVYRPLLFETREVLSPACYRCPHNKAEPVRGSDARETRSCRWECVDELEQATRDVRASAFVLEPLAASGWCSTR
jgi:adenosylmethionine-8-amino-7-oxononanoate aminotransferase